jgi:hypothetical protein
MCTDALDTFSLYQKHNEAHHSVCATDAVITSEEREVYVQRQTQSIKQQRVNYTP